MIPNLTVMVAAYIILRALVVLVHEHRSEHRSMFLFIASIVTIFLVCICTYDTVSKGVDVQAFQDRLLNSTANAIYGNSK